MADIKEFVVNDRRKFTAEGDVRPDAPPSEPKPPRPETLTPQPPPPDAYDSSARLTTPTGPQAVPDPIAAAPGDDDASQPPPLTAEQTSQASQAYNATVDRLDTAIRATNPGMERAPEMTFERVVQSIYMQALLQLGGATEPGQPPRVDLLGARQTIDMLNIFAEKTTGNLSPAESNLLDSALFELRMGFLEVTQAMARQAQSKATGAPPPGPTIVR
jgi:hypothetical protein